ncbi:MAG: hypothetical protein AAFN77_08905 [Planctomycetota bacterium]
MMTIDARNFYSPILVLAVALCSLALTMTGNVVLASAPQDSLTNEQKKQLDSAKSAFRRIKANVSLAESTAGAGDGALTGSRAKLTRVRLGSSANDLPKIESMVSGLPASQADVAAFLEELESAKSSIELLGSRLDGKSAKEKDASPKTDSKTGTTSESSTQPAMKTPAAKTVRLGYPHEDTFRAAKFNLREVEGNLNALDSVVKEYQPVADQLAVPFKKIRSTMATIDNAKRKLGFATESLKKLPANGEGVAEVRQRIEAAGKRMETATQYLLPLHQKLSKLIDPKNYPSLNSDLKRLQDIGQMFGNPLVLQTDLKRAANVLSQQQASVDEIERVRTDYQRLITQQSDEGIRLDKACQYLEKQIAKFGLAAKQYESRLPSLIQKHLAEAESIADEAVAKQKPLFFTGGIPQVLGFAEEKISLLKTMNQNSAASLEKELATLRSKLKNAEQKLAAAIIKSNALPKDSYRASDRDQVISVAIDAWKYQQPSFKVLSKRIPSDVWSRETMWQYSNGTWYFVDRSKLAVYLVIADKENAKQAILRPVTIIKDHQKGDKMIGVPLWSIKDELSPKSYMLRSNVK